MTGLSPKSRVSETDEVISSFAERFYKQGTYTRIFGQMVTEYKGTPYVDTDGDGMPDDEWKPINGFESE